MYIVHIYIYTRCGVNRFLLAFFFGVSIGINSLMVNSQGKLPRGKSLMICKLSWYSNSHGKLSQGKLMCVCGRWCLLVCLLCHVVCFVCDTWSQWAVSGIVFVLLCFCFLVVMFVLFLFFLPCFALVGMLCVVALCCCLLWQNVLLFVWDLFLDLLICLFLALFVVWIVLVFDLNFAEEQLWAEIADRVISHQTCDFKQALHNEACVVADLHIAWLFGQVLETHNVFNRYCSASKEAPFPYSFSCSANCKCNPIL